MSQSGGAATKLPEPRMEHGLNTERESALMALEKEEITEKISSQLHLKGLFWESVFNPCSIRGSPENLVGKERFLLMGKDQLPGGLGRASVRPEIDRQSQIANLNSQIPWLRRHIPQERLGTGFGEGGIVDGAIQLDHVDVAAKGRLEGVEQGLVRRGIVKLLSRRADHA